MSNRAIEKTVIFYEIIGFSLIIILLWVDEIFDIPCLIFGAPATPFNWVEGIIETVGIIILSVIIIVISVRMLSKIRNLEGFLPVCSFCKKIRVKNEWIPIEVYLSEHSDAVFSHGFCPECIKKHYPEFSDDDN